MQSMNYIATLEKLDPNRRCSVKLFRDSSRIVNGKEIKDLNFANRDLARVLVIDTSYDNVSHKENTIIVPPYTGSNDDLHLVEVDAFLQCLSWAKPKDLRPFIKLYQEKGPLFFKQKYNELQKRRIERDNDW